MQSVNLRKYYYPLYCRDMFVEVSDEVAEALQLMYREENNRTRKMYYHKAYYSLDREDGIENEAVCGYGKSPEEILMEQEEERLFLLTLEWLEEALSCLTPVQQRRIHARYLTGRKVREIADREGVSAGVVFVSIRSGLKNLREHFERNGGDLKDEFYRK